MLRSPEPTNTQRCKCRQEAFPSKKSVSIICFNDDVEGDCPIGSTDHQFLPRSGAVGDRLGSVGRNLAIEWLVEGQACDSRRPITSILGVSDYAVNNQHDTPYASLRSNTRLKQMANEIMRMSKRSQPPVNALGCYVIILGWINSPPSAYVC